MDNLSLTLSQLDIPSLVNHLILFTTHMVAFIAGFIAASYFDAVQHHWSFTKQSSRIDAHLLLDLSRSFLIAIFDERESLLYGSSLAMCPSANSSVGTCVHDASHAYKSEVPVESKSSSEQPEQPESERRMDPDIPSEMLCEIATLEKKLNDFTKSWTIRAPKENTKMAS